MKNFIGQKTKVLVMSRNASFMLFALIFAAALSYVYFANAAVRALTVLEKTKQEMQSLSVEVSEMESKRLSLENNIGAEMAVRMGFVAVDHPTFIMKGSKKASLSLKTN